MRETVAKNLRNGNAKKVSLSLEDIKLTKILFATVVGFVFCWTPLLVLDVVDDFLGSGWELTRETYYMHSVFGFSSSAINPIIYGVMNPSYRRAYLRLFGIHRVGRVDVEVPANVHDQRRDQSCRNTFAGTEQFVDQLNQKPWKNSLASSLFSKSFQWHFSERKLRFPFFHDFFLILGLVTAHIFSSFSFVYISCHFRQILDLPAWLQRSRKSNEKITSCKIHDFSTCLIGSYTILSLYAETDFRWSLCEMETVQS